MMMQKFRKNRWPKAHYNWTCGKGKYGLVQKVSNKNGSKKHLEVKVNKKRYYYGIMPKL